MYSPLKENVLASVSTTRTPQDFSIYPGSFIVPHRWMAQRPRLQEGAERKQQQRTSWWDIRGSSNKVMGEHNPQWCSDVHVRSSHTKTRGC
jgi:hypothetical protein